MRTLWLFACLPFALACTEEVESTDIRTSGIYPEIEVTATGNGRSRVEVQLKVGGEDSNTYLQLRGEDTLEVTVGEETKTLDEGGSNTYSATFDVDEEGTEFVVAFLRGDEDDGAPESVAILPAPFDLTVTTTEASRATDAVDFSWEPPGTGTMDWAVSGDCIQSEKDDTADDGEVSIPVGRIETFQSDAEETCVVELEVIRSQSGEVDSAFTEGGSVVARQLRRGTFTSTP